MSDTGQFVIRTRVALRRVLLLRVAMGAIGLFALYVVFEFGRYSVGYDRVAESERFDKLKQQIQALQRENHDLRTQLAAVDNERAGRAREREEVATQIAGLQAQIDRDRQDLAVYRGVVAPASQAGSVQVQQLRLAAGDSPQQYRVYLTLMQAGKPDATISGTVQVRVPIQGVDSAPASRQAATAGGKYSFRYYQALEYSVQLPSGAQPLRVDVELRPDRSGAAAVTQSFPWKLDPT